MFGTNLDVEISCLDPQCGGTMVAQFEDKTGVAEVVTYCSSCGHAYDVFRKNFSDTPDDEVSWSVNAHNE